MTLFAPEYLESAQLRRAGAGYVFHKGEGLGIYDDNAGAAELCEAAGNCLVLLYYDGWWRCSLFCVYWSDCHVHFIHCFEGFAQNISDDDSRRCVVKCPMK